VLVFIDRDVPGRKFGWPASHEAGVRDMFKKTELPHESDPSVLDQVAKAMEQTSE
jgi:hypothetical protein